ncbi:BTB/POZ domain-containing protein 2 [Falco biarmicus]|uniref:BTB/POZ domain-containing protein 2 n=1 Tax=Falco cherrug TaxID=345164 RepID=UPI001886865F|nr:BTB/POZ domain-containing protein 2 isoform X1 [Falco rusticolus]XP_040444973.1 BTB/POZ domain-containing protein 2 isoform X1 [Falco naumanni]XP_055563738.1 BTB/POZ domain-containing protein 2 [Falco cherrug]XP_056190409.1 BTB/POZ domain-containing protein 2 [Falco biarmicus]
MRRCCPALCISTGTAGTGSRRGAARPAAIAIAAPLPPAAVSRPPLLVLVLLQRRPAPPAPAPPPHKMAAGGSGGGPGGLSSSCPQPPPPPPAGNGAAAAACTNGAPASPPGLTYNQCGAANPAAGGGGGAGGPAAAAAAGAAGAAGGAGGPGGALQREPVYNWQATKPTVQERFAFLFNNEVLSDVHFLVGKGRGSQRIPAHRFVLAVGSAVFDAMFNGGMATTSTEIELPDVEPAAFLALLKFLYSDEVQIGPETVMTTLYTAKKYAVPALEAHCVEFLKKNLRADNAFMLLTQARLFDEPQLASLCLENIDKNTSDAINAEGFTDIDLDTLVAVLERDTLGIREVRLFNAVVRWSEAECQRQQLQVIPENKRKVLGKALSLIRFPLMTIEEFAAGPAQSGILTDREVVSLFLHFTVNPKPRVEFIDRPRCCLRGKECSISRFQQVESRWGYSGTSDRIRFSVNKRIFVVGFGLYGSIHGPTDYQVNIQIIHTDSNTVLGQNDTGFSCDGSSNTFRVMFKEPVEILPNVNYTACATLKGPDSHYGTKGLRKVIHESPTTGAKTCFTFCYAAGNNNGTSVEDGQIPEIIFYT